MVGQDREATEPAETEQGAPSIVLRLAVSGVGPSTLDRCRCTGARRVPPLSKEMGAPDGAGPTRWVPTSMLIAGPVRMGRDFNLQFTHFFYFLYSRGFDPSSTLNPRSTIALPVNIITVTTLFLRFDPYSKALS